jgi:hypothetical protein
MKSPPVQYNDDIARRMTEEFVRQTSSPVVPRTAAQEA